MHKAVSSCLRNASRQPRFNPFPALKAATLSSSSRNKSHASTAIVEDGAFVHSSAFVGHFSVIGPGVTVADRCHIHPHVVLVGNTEIGEQTTIHSFATVGGLPQNKKNALSSRLIVGKRCMIRENVTLNAGTTEPTIVKDDCWILAGAHVGHDAVIEEHVVLSNGAQVAGHVRIGAWSILGGLAAVQQFCCVGRGAMIGGGAMVDRHVPPYSLIIGNRARFHGINLRGLRRRGVANSHIFPLLHAAKRVYSSSDVINNARHELANIGGLETRKELDLAREFLEFIVDVSNVRDHWCARRSGIGIIGKT